MALSDQRATIGLRKGVVHAAFDTSGRAGCLVGWVGTLPTFIFGALSGFSKEQNIFPKRVLA